jgi:hypothetical protein
MSSWGFLLGVSDGVSHDVMDVFVDERVHDLLALPLRRDEPRAAQDAQVLGDERLADIERVHELVHTARSLGERHNHRETQGVAQRP